MNKLLEGVATAVLRFRKRTGRHCPRISERKAMGIHSEALSSTTHWISLECETLGGFNLMLFSRTDVERVLMLDNGCRIVTVRGNTIGPFLPSRQGPKSRDQFEEDTMQREHLKCATAAYVTMTDCNDDGECTSVSVNEWLEKHPRQ